MTEHVIETAEQLRSSYGEPSERAARKSLDHLDRHCRRFIALSPFVVLASAGADGAGRLLAARRPRGVRRGPRRSDGSPARQARQQPRGLAEERPRKPVRGIAVPDTGGGRDAAAERPGDADHRPEPARALSVKGRAPRSGLVIEVEEVFLQCTKALVPLPAVGGRVAGGPQGSAAFVRTDARRPRRPARRRGGGAGGSGQDPQDDVLIRAPPEGGRGLRRRQSRGGHAVARLLRRHAAAGRAKSLARSRPSPLPHGTEPRTVEGSTACR